MRESANRKAFAKISGAAPVVIDVQPAIDVVPGMARNIILTSGASMPWERYYGGQRAAVLGAAEYEGLASNPLAAEEKIRSGEIVVAGCHDYGCVGSLAGIYTASMPVFVVDNPVSGNRSFCNLFEGKSPFRLNYGVYNQKVRDNLIYLQDEIAPILGRVIRASGGVELSPIIKRALHMGDELHSRNTAATLLFNQKVFPALMKETKAAETSANKLYEYLSGGDYFFLRLSMAASKAASDSAHGVEGSSMVTAMAFNCRDFSIRVSGLGDDWFSAKLPPVAAKLFPNHDDSEIEFMGGESTINETAGLGGFAQAAAFPLQEYQGGSVDHMIQMNLAMYQITLGEHPEYRIPYFSYRGTPTGIDIFRVVESGQSPVMDIGVAGKDGGQIGAGVLTAPVECFQQAVAAYRERYVS